MEVTLQFHTTSILEVVKEPWWQGTRG